MRPKSTSGIFCLGYTVLGFSTIWSWQNCKLALAFNTSWHWHWHLSQVGIGIYHKLALAFITSWHWHLSQVGIGIYHQLTLALGGVMRTNQVGSPGEGSFQLIQRSVEGTYASLHRLLYTQTKIF